jgi:DNA-binding winged helix-turn-helix (wHTH) protein/Tol biopolymer transport system component
MNQANPTSQRKPGRVFRFGPNELDLTEYELRRNGARMPLARLPLDLLIIFVERAGQLVTREELETLLWPEKEAVVDTRAGLNNAVSRLRSVLNDNAEKPRYIETVIGRGYRFIGTLKETGETPVPGMALLSAEIVTELVPLPSPTPPIPRKRMWVRAAISSFTILAAAIGGWWVLQAPKEHVRFTAAQVTTNDGANQVNVASISPSGQTVAYADGSGIFVRSLSDGIVHRLRFPADLEVESLSWSPDEATVLAGGFRRGENQWQIWSLRLLGGDGRRIVAGGRQPNISPDSERIAFTTEDESEIHVSDLHGENSRLLAGSLAKSRVLSIAWSHDGRRVLYLERARKPGVLPAELLVELNYPTRYVSRSILDGHITAEQEADQFDSLAASSDGTLYLLSRHVLRDGVRGLGIWSVSTNRTTGAFLASPRSIIPVPDNVVTSLSVSLNGTRIAALLEKGEADVYLADNQNAPLNNRRRLTLDSRRDYPNAWTADGSSILFESDRSGHFHLYRQALDSSTAELLTDMGGDQVSSTLTPDGRWVLFKRMIGDQVKTWEGIYRVSVEGGTPVKIPVQDMSEEVRCPTLGSVCITRRSLAGKLFRFSALDPLTGVERLLVEAPWTPVVFGDWAVAPDGSSVALPGHDVGWPEIRIVPLESSVPPRILKVQSTGQLWGLHWDIKGIGWFGEIRFGDVHSLSHIDSEGRVEELYRTGYNTWAVPSPTSNRLAFLDYTTDRNVWVWRR